MPIYSIQGPDGKIYEIEGPAGATKAQVVAAIQAKMQASAPAPAPVPMPVVEPAKKEGFGAALGKGIEGILSPSRTAIGALTGSAEEAALAGLKRSEASPYADQVSLDKVKAALDRGLLPAAGEVLRQMPLAITEQAPNIAATLGSAKAGSLLGAKLGTAIAPGVGTAVGTIGGGILGAVAPSLLQQFGGNIQRQAQEQLAAKQPVDISRTAAAAAALPQAGLDVAATFIPLGRTVAGSVLGPQVKQLLERGAQEGAEKLARESLPKVLAKGAGISVATEAPTEVVQSMLERAQAGLPLLSEDALNEYGEAAYQASLIAPIGSAARVGERSAARQQTLPPENRPGETDRQAAERIQAEILEMKRAAQPPAPGPILDTNKLYTLMTQPNGYGLVEQYKQRLLALPKQTPEIKEAIEAASFIQNRSVIEKEQRRTTKPAPEELVPPKGPDAGEAVTPPSGESVQVAGEPDTGSATERPAVTEPAGVVPPVEDVGQPPRGEAPAPAAVAPKVEALQGSETRLILPDGQKRPAKWEVIEADSVSAAMFEGRAQPRDRQRAASNAQVQSIANNPDFDRLSDTSQTMDYGAPTLTGEYVIVGGNGRFEGVNLSYDTEAGQAYKQNLISNAQRFGLDPAQVSGMKKPVLIRKIPSEAAKPDDTRKLAIQSNIVAGLEMSDMERAALDSERMTNLQELDITDTGDIPLTTKNMGTIRDALKGYTKEELSGMLAADGSLSQSGLRRVKNAVLYKAYGKTDTLSRLLESPDADLKNVGTALMRASGSMSRLMDGIKSGAIPADYDIIADLTGAVETLSALRASGTKVQDFISQSDMFGGGISNEAKTILTFLDQNLRSAKSITEFLNDYANAAISAESAGDGLFGEVQLPSKQETIERAAQRPEAERAAAKAQQTIFEQPAGAPAEEGAAKPEGAGRPLEGGEGAVAKPAAAPAAPPVKMKIVKTEVETEGGKTKGAWNVVDASNDQIVDTFNTRKEAQEYVNKGKEPKKSLVEMRKRYEAGRAAPAEAPAETTPEQTELDKEIEAKIEELGRVLSRIMGRFGLKDVALNLVENMKAEGEYSQSVIRLALDAVSPVQALRHESIHALKELGFFSPQQWAVLEKQAKSKWIDQYLKNVNVNKEPLGEGEKSRYDAYMDLYKGDMDAIIEEAIADAFGDFDVNKAPPGMMQAILNRLRNFFDAVKTAFGGEVTAEQVFRKVEKGELKAEAAPATKAVNKASLRGEGFESFDEDYPTPESVADGFKRGELVVHARTKDDTDFRYGIEPSIGELVKSTEAYQGMIERYGEAPELTFFSDNTSDIDSWAKFFAKRDTPVQMVFVRKTDSMQKSLGNGKVMTSDGKTMSYEMSPLADYENELMRGEPAFVETGDWYTNKDQDVVAVMDYAPSAKPSLRAPKTEAFKRWSGGAPVVGLRQDHVFVSGKPVVAEALHGTTNADITEFKKSQANIESDFGAGFYASNTPADVAINYANVEGADLTRRIETLAERIADNEEFEGDMDAAMDEARKRLSQGAPNTMKLYMLFKNPAVLGGKGETFFDYTQSYNEETDEYGEPTGSLVDFVNQLDEIGDGLDISMRDIERAKDELIDAGRDNEGVKFSQLVQIVKDRFDSASALEDGSAANGEVLRQALEGMGFDGVIDTNAYAKFGPRMIRGAYSMIKTEGMAGLDKDTVHFVAFKPTQIKSATGNIGTFDKTNPDIRYSLRSAKWADKRIERLIDEFGYTDGRTKAYAAKIAPADFVYSTTESEEAAQNIYDEAGDLDLQSLTAESQTPFLYVETSGPNWKIVGHEGRHRMAALDGAGVTEVPVVLIMYKDGGRSPAMYAPKETANLQGQEFDTEEGTWSTVKNLVPISYKYTQELKDTFGGEGKVKFSLRSTIPTATRQRIVQTTVSRDEKTFYQRIIEAISPSSFQSFRADALNRYDRLGVYDKKLAEKMGGKALLANSSAEAAALLSDLGAGLTASALGVHDRMGGIPVYRNGITIISNMNGKVKGPTAIFAPLAREPGDYQAYQYWAAVKRGMRLMYTIDPKTGETVEKLITAADGPIAEALRKQYLKDFKIDFNAIQEDWIKYNDGLVDYMLATGVLSKERASLYKQYADYLPFYRQMNGEETVGPKIFQSIAGVKPPKKIKGGEARIDDFLENIVRNTQSAIQAGVKNIASKAAADVAVKIQMAERLDYQSSAPNVFHVYEDGKPVSYETEDQLFINAIKSLGLPDLPFIGFLSGPANLLRNLVTKDPGFMLANLMRDSMSAWVTSGVKMTPMVDTISNFGSAIAGKSPEFQALMNAGILGGYEFSQNVEQSGREFGKALRKQAKVKQPGMKGVLEMGAKPFTSLWDALEKGSTASDAATRIEIYKKTLAETGNEAEALYRALEVMNFNRKGSSAVIRILTAAVPFLNARMQGLDVLYRASTGNMNAVNAKQIQKNFFVRGAMIAALSTAYWALTHDDEEYKKQEQETRDNYWLLPSLGVKIPIPFEIGVLFKVIPERILGYTMGSDTGEDFLKSMARQLTSTLAFNPIPQTVLPVVESMTNFSFFTMRPIVGQGLEGLEPAYQVAPGTTRIAEAIGSATKGLPKELQISPAKMDQLISGYTGTMGMYMVNLMDAIFDMNTDSPKPSRRFEQLPLIRRFALDPEARGAVTGYYELKNSVDSIVRTSNMLERTMNYEELPGYLQDNARMLATKDYLLDLEKTMKEFREMKIMIRSAKMSADAKGDAIASIEKMENQLTANIQYLKRLAKGG